jgi:surfactin synthase thioesterase subunit
LAPGTAAALTDRAMSESPWFVPSSLDAPVARVLAVPFAGGGVGVYASWAGALPAGVEVLPVQLPGRERRLRESPYRSMRALLADLGPAVVALAPLPTVVFGHSMGAAIAYELALALTRAGTPPAHLVVSARRAPGSAPVHLPLFALPEDRLIAETERLYGPLPAVLREQPGLRATFLPTMRADMQLLDTWIPPDPGQLACPVTVIAGADDLAVPLDRLSGWSAVTTGPTHVEIVPGNHFSYLREGTAARDLVARVAAGLSGAARP